MNVLQEPVLARNTAGDFAARQCESTFQSFCPNSITMQKFAHIIAVMFLALFAVGSVVHAVSANSMALDMAAAAGDTDVMPDCQGCEADAAGTSNAGSCELDCTTPGIAALDAAPGPLFAMVTASQNRLPGMSLPSGWRGAPDPFPPRSLI